MGSEAAGNAEPGPDKAVHVCAPSVPAVAEKPVAQLTEHDPVSPVTKPVQPLTTSSVLAAGVTQAAAVQRKQHIKRQSGRSRL